MRTTTSNNIELAKLTPPRLALQPKRVASLIRRGVDLLTQGEAEEWYRGGLRSWDQENYKEAAPCFVRALELDPVHLEANTLLGKLLQHGVGVPQNPSEAANRFRIAADRGLALAQFYLGYAYANGEGLPQDYSQAAFWYRKAAEQGEALAQSFLGRMYNEGHCVPQKGQDAAFWFSQAVASWHNAAKRGDTAAQFNLGFAYEHGEGVEQDWTVAAFWYRMAAEQGHKKARQYFDNAVDKLAVDRDTNPNTTYINLDELLKLDEMLEEAGLIGVEGWGDLKTLRSGFK